ncbi:PDZ domain-containing protein 4 [Labeo rohita]|uniref:PDZ domain-containing protein 4 n=1 Tax=Labeo rohita TaxID=84645 RepID=A0ABQ8LB75_LABRO|nr:PDZ domain-containing protein 4 [Labeo rohita]
MPPVQKRPDWPLLGNSVSAQVIEEKHCPAPDFDESQEGGSGNRQIHPLEVPDPGDTGHPGVINPPGKRPNAKSAVAVLWALYGHRGGVFQNITIQEVLAAQKSTSQKAYLVNVTSHKMNQASGPAQIALTEEEYGWARRFLHLKDQLPDGTDAKYLFFTSMSCTIKPVEAPSNKLHAKFTHTSEDRLKISKFMCHDVRMADKFYVTNLSAQQATERRRLFEFALEGPERSPPEHC